MNPSPETTDIAYILDTKIEFRDVRQQSAKEIVDPLRGAGFIRQRNFHLQSCTPQNAYPALELARTFPSGVLTSQVCPYCYNSGYSSPGTRCSYCRSDQSKDFADSPSDQPVSSH